jgi:hypothetical protein
MLDRRLERRRVPAGLSLDHGDRRVDHHLPPHQPPVLIPGDLLQMGHRSSSALLGNRLVVRCHGLRDSIDCALNGPSADGHPPQDRRAKCLHGAATVARRARRLPDEGRQPGPIPLAILGRKLGLDQAATSGARRLGPHDMRHGHLDLGPLDHLVRRGRRRRRTRLLPIGTGVRRDLDALPGPQQRWAMPRMSRLRSWSPRRG